MLAQQLHAVEPVAPARIPCHDPATGEALGEVAVDGPERVRAAVAAAREAQRAWRKSSFAQRREVLQRMLEHLLEHADELVDHVVRDSGKTRENALLGEIWPVAEKIRALVAEGEAHLRPERVSSGLFPHKKALIEFHPLGVVGIIAPWNYPLQNILGPAIPALFAGNGVVVKVSEAVAWSGARFKRIFDEALQASGFSPDLVQIVNGYGETGAALVSGGVDLLIFTGSIANGRKVIVESAKTVTPVILELGGKDPMIVCDDAHLDEAVHTAMAGVFIAAGQNCMSAERVIVMEGIHDAFVSRVVEMTRSLRQGPPREGIVDVGAIVSPAQVKVIEDLVDDAVARGARVLAGGKRTLTGTGQYFEPTVLVDVTPDMRIMREETFGPIMVITRVRDEREAIELANASEYGLNASVLSRDSARAKRIADQIEAGGTCINGFGLTYMAQDLPFGGIKGSGFGRLNGREGLRACTTRKAVLADRIPLHIPFKLYPVAPKDYAVTRSVIQMIYGRGLLGRLRGLAGLVKTALGGEAPRA
jgi:acyl-CoA reductase-like NAD-dependent aldehyde dehydrogenase